MPARQGIEQGIDSPEQGVCKQVEAREERTRFDGVKVEVLGATYEPGKPVGKEEGNWRGKLRNRDEMLRYLKTGERYWYSTDWYGSERRKNPA